MSKPLPLFLLLLLGACAAGSVIDESRDCAAVGRFQRAFDLVDAERERVLAAGGGVPFELEQAWQEARQAYLIEHGRRLLFAEFEDEALVAFSAVLEFDPDNEEVLRLRQRVFEKKAAVALKAGEELFADRHYAEALAAFARAERILPGTQAAIDGQKAVREQIERQTERAQAQFLEAVRKLPEFRYLEVNWHSASALVDDPSRQDVVAMRDRVLGELARAALERGRQNEAAGQFGAALIEFRSAQKLAPGSAGVDEAIAGAEREVEAARLAEEARMHMRRQEFDEARSLLDQAFAQSALLRGGISELMLENRRLQAQSHYTDARNLEYQGLKQEALAAYVALSAEWPDGLEDEKARIDALQTDIAGARKEWELAGAAEQEGRLADAIEHYRASARFYERLHDAKARIAKLAAQLAAAGGS